MSVVVVVKKAGRIAIAADTQTTSGYVKISGFHGVRVTKIMKLSDTYIGIVGSAAHYRALESMFKKDFSKPNFRNEQAIFKTFQKGHKILKKRYFMKPSTTDGSPYESSDFDLLIANHFGIFGIDSLRDVTEFSKFWAVGSGRECALGAMSVCYKSSSTAEAIAKAGVEAACEFDNYCGLPVHVHSFKLSLGGTSRSSRLAQTLATNE